MRIGIDATTWWNRRGFGRFTRRIVTAMLDEPCGHEFVLFVDQEPAPEMVRPGVEIVQVMTQAAVTESAVADGRRRVGDLLAFRRAVAARPLDVVYFPAVYSWFPAGGRAPSVITFHDAIAEHHTELVFPDRLGRLFWNLKTWMARRSAAGFTTVSHAARDEIVRYMGIPGERIHVILEAADPIFRPVREPAPLRAVRARLGLPADARLLLYVGGLAPHKNLLRLTEAFAGARARKIDDLHLVFVGDPKGDGFLSNYETLRKSVEQDENLQGSVHFTGYVSDEDLVHLYSDAHMVAMPALSEGFGLPAAEAIACGTPVIATRGGAVQEVVGQAGLFFDPLDVQEMTDVIVRMASDPELYQALRASCAPRAAELSWTTAARELLGVLEQYARVR